MTFFCCVMNTSVLQMQARAEGNGTRRIAPRSCSIPQACNLHPGCGIVTTGGVGARLAAESIPPPSQRDPELVRRVRAGERQLFHELVRPYEHAVFITTYGILRDLADAEEAAQETMLKALMHLDQLTVPEKFKGWLLQIAVNEARLKRRGRHANMFESLNANPGAEEPFMPRDFADWRELPSDVAERKEIRKHIARALHSLPDIYRETLILRDVEQLSAADAAGGVRDYCARR